MIAGMKSTSHDNNNISILFLENSTYYYDNMTSSTSDTSWIMILLDRSQQVMTIIGLIANMGTFVTLIKNGEVSVTSIRKWICWCDRCQMNFWPVCIILHFEPTFHNECNKLPTIPLLASNNDDKNHHLN